GARNLNRLSLYEGSLHRIVAWFADVRGDRETARVQQRTGVGEHRGAAAHHHAVEAWVEGGQTQVAEQLAGFDQGRQTAVIRMRFAGDRRVVAKFLAHRRPQDLVLAQILDEVLHDVGFRQPAYSVHEDHV